MKRIEHRESKWEFPFVEYLSEIKKGKMPLIVQLHGADERGNGTEDLSKVEAYGFSRYLNENVCENAKRDFLLVMPQCPSETFWAARVETIIRFVEHIIEEYDVDKDRVYLTGLSMGGYGTWYTAMARPELFAAIFPVCGGGMAWNAGVLKMPVRVVHGADDTVVSPTQSDEMVSALKNAGTDVTYIRLEGVGHSCEGYAYTGEALDWMLSKKRT